MKTYRISIYLRINYAEVGFVWQIINAFGRCIATSTALQSREDCIAEAKTFAYSFAQGDFEFAI